MENRDKDKQQALGQLPRDTICVSNLRVTGIYWRRINSYDFHCSEYKKKKKKKKTEKSTTALTLITCAFTLGSDGLDEIFNTWLWMGTVIIIKEVSKCAREILGNDLF